MVPRRDIGRGADPGRERALERFHQSHTGQARQDVVLMGEQYISNDAEAGGEVLNWVRKKTKDKTGLELAIPVHPELRRIIDATPSGQGPTFDQPFGLAF
jgi:hypothetical protein